VVKYQSSHFQRILLMKIKKQKLLLMLFIILIQISFSGKALAQKTYKTIFQCLGREEALIHKKKLMGALYNLNQRMINTFIVSSDLQLRPEFIQEVCSSKSFSPSVNLLRLLMMKKKDPFINQEPDAISRLQKEQMIEQFLEDIPTLFFQYLGDIQAQLPTSECLTQAIPELKAMLEKYQFLGVEREWNQSILSKGLLDTIFLRLTQLNAINKECLLKKEKSKIVPALKHP
jgi:hypothetical protein